MTRKLLFACALLCAISANAQPNRLIAFAEYSFDDGIFKKTDTDRYYYSQDRSVMNEMSQADNPKWAADSIVGRIHDFITGTDENFVKTCQEFDGDSLLMVKHTLLWTNNTWDSTGRGHYHYSADGIDTFTLLNKQGPNWVPNIRYINEYGPDGITFYWFQVWNVGSNDFVNSSRTTFTYGSGQLTEEMTEFWNGSVWTPNTRQLYT